MGKIVWNEAQGRIITFRKGNMIVSASAGSGKTTVMLERVLRIIEEGTPIDRIVILAFNRSIASEIRLKLYNKLYKRIAEGQADNIPFLCEQLDKIHLANIVTNDAYCSQTVKEFFHLLGIDPALDMLGDQEGKLLYAKCYDTALHDLPECGEDWIFDLIDKFGGRDNLLEQIRAVHNFVATIPDSREWLDSVVDKVYSDRLSTSKAIEYLRAMLGTRAEYALWCVERQREILAPEGLEEKGNIAQLQGFFSALSEAESYEEMYSLVNGFEYPRKITTVAKIAIDWDEHKKYYGFAKGCYEWACKMLSVSPQYAGEVHRRTSIDVANLMTLYRAVEKIFAGEKAKGNKFEFSDMVQYTLQVLSDPDIARSVSERYDYICIDEYQDTNYAQESMFNRISSGDNLFMVGDSKQSIYRFRLSEPKILIDKYAAYESGRERGETVHLDYNYRSSSHIIDFVNRIFDVIMTRPLTGVDYAKTDRLQYGAKYQDTMLPPCTVQLFKEPDEDKDRHVLTDGVYSVRSDDSTVSRSGRGAAEGMYIADKIKEMVGKAKIYDSTIECERLVQYRDIVLLARAYDDTVRDILSALQNEHIPVNIGGLAKFGEVYEVEIIKSVLRTIACDRDDVALTSFLGSYWCGMSMQELYDIRQRHRDCEYFYEACLAERANNPQLADAYALLDSWRIKASYMTVYELVRHIVYDYSYDRYMLACDGGNYKLTVLGAFMDTLSTLGAGVTVSEYVAGNESSELRLESTLGGDSVTALTIHKSKGLEYPIVFLINAADKLTGNRQAKLQLDRDMGVAINYFDSERRVSVGNLIFNIFAEKENLDDKAEAMRLLYVALTRAKNHIFITATVGAKESRKPRSVFEANSFLHWLYQAADSDSYIDSLIHEPIDYRRSEGIVERFTFRQTDISVPEIDRYLDYSYPHSESEKICIKYSVTEINHIDSYEDDIRRGATVVEEDSYTGSRAQRGTDYHAILENIDYDRYSPSEVEAQLHEMVTGGILTAEQIAVVDIAEISRVLGSNIIELARNNIHYREREFMLCVPACEVMNTTVTDKILVQGAIDLIIDGDELVIVDFKKSGQSTEVLRDRYRKQIELYTMAVEAALGRRVDRRILYVIGRDEVIDYPCGLMKS